MSLFKLMMATLYEKYLGKAVLGHDGKPHVVAHIRLDNTGTTLMAEFYDRSKHEGYHILPVLTVSHYAELPAVVPDPEFSI